MSGAYAIRPYGVGAAEWGVCNTPVRGGRGGMGRRQSQSPKPDEAYHQSMGRVRHGLHNVGAYCLRPERDCHEDATGPERDCHEDATSPDR